MGDWLEHLKNELAANPGKPMKEVIEIAKVTIHQSPKSKILKNKGKKKKKQKS